MPSEVLHRIPKRRIPLDFDRREREYFWGLLAVQRISNCRVILYHILILTGPFIFWWLWIFYRSNPDDLQNASVPFSTISVLLSLFWFPLLQRREVQKRG